jgi:hypothetical protein
MIIDCDTCTVRGNACADCVVTVLLGAPPAAGRERVELDGAEREAIAVLAGSGLVPPLRLLPALEASVAHPGSPFESRPEGGAGQQAAGGRTAGADPGPAAGEPAATAAGDERAAARSVKRRSPALRRPGARRAAG